MGNFGSVLRSMIDYVDQNLPQYLGVILAAGCAIANGFVDRLIVETPNEAAHRLFFLLPAPNQGIERRKFVRLGQGCGCCTVWQRTRQIHSAPMV